MKPKNEMFSDSEQISYLTPSTSVCKIAYPNSILKDSLGYPTETEEENDVG